MTSPFSVNIHISAGSDFAQEFYLANPDRSSMDITGCKFTGTIQKHPGAIDAIETELAGITGSDVNNIKYKGIVMNIIVSNGKKGIYRIDVPGNCTYGIQEGKYYYGVNMTDVNGSKIKVLSGLCFIDFGTIG